PPPAAYIQDGRRLSNDFMCVILPSGTVLSASSATIDTPPITIDSGNHFAPQQSEASSIPLVPPSSAS
ncbi:hypothetical protein FRC01_000270, partial [Tulasnella sp. 417]